MRIPLTLLSFFCALSVHLFGQTNKHYTEKDGLVSNTVYHIYPDSKGFLWFGTDKGVSRFDGQTFKNYNTSKGLINDDIFVISEDKYGRIWLASHATGLCYIENDSVREYLYNDVLIKNFPNKSVKLSLKIEDNGSVYLGDDVHGLIHIDTNGTFEILGEDTRNVFDFDGTILTASIKSIKKNESFVAGEYKMNFFKKNHLSESTRLQLEPYRFNSSLGSHYAIISGKDTISVIHGDMYFLKTKDKSNVSFLDYYTDCIYKDNKGRIWIGSRFSEGVYVYGSANLKHELFRFLEGNIITHVTEDFQEGIWCSTLENGVYYLGNVKTTLSEFSTFKSNGIKEAIKGPGQSVFMMLENGDVWLYDGNTMKKLVSFSEDEVFEKNTMYFDSLSSTFYVKYKSINYTSASFRIKRIPLKTEVEPLSLSYLIHAFPNGEIIDFRGRGIYGEKDGLWNKRTILMNDEYDKATSSYFFRDTLWIGTMNGLSYIKDLPDGLRKYPAIQGNKVSDIEHFEEEMAIALEDKGIFFRSKKKEPRLVSKGFTSLKIKSISYDARGNLFVVSGDGLYKINPAEQSAKRISNQQIGLSSNMNDIICREEGILLVTDNGPIYISYDDLNSEVLPPKTIIEISSINGKYQKNWDRRELKYNENNIGIEFTSITYSEYQKPIYAWKINKANGNWVQTNNPSVYLNQLKPGHYEIIVKSSSLPQLWSEESSISFTIRPPFYLTWWFITISSIGMLFLIFGAIVWKIELERKKARREIQLTKEKANLEMRALRAQMNPHFIFNTLTSIQYLINSGQNDRAEYYLEKFSRLLRLIVDKSDQAKVTLIDELDVLRIYIDLENLRFDDKFQFKVNVPDEMDLERIRIPGMLLQPFVENAIEHGLSPKEGKGLLEVTVEKIGGLLKLVVYDDGIGREKSRHKKISRKRHQRSVGMMNVKRRLDIMSQELGEGAGQIEIEDLKNDSGEACGTRITIFIKYDNI